MFYASSNLKKQHISNLISVYKRFGKNIVSIQNILKTINRNERSKMCTWYRKKKRDFEQIRDARNERDWCIDGVSQEAHDFPPILPLNSSVRHYADSRRKEEKKV